MFYVCSYIAKIKKKKKEDIDATLGVDKSVPAQHHLRDTCWGCEEAGCPGPARSPLFRLIWHHFLFLMEFSRKDGVCLPQVLTQRSLHNVTAAKTCLLNAHLPEMSSNHLMVIKYVNALSTEISPAYPNPHLSESPSHSL